MHLRQSEKLGWAGAVWGGMGWGGKSRTGTDWRVRGGRESEVERISETERRRAEERGRYKQLHKTEERRMDLIVRWEI